MKPDQTPKSKMETNLSWGMPQKLIRLVALVLALLKMFSETNAAAQSATVFGFEIPSIGANYQYNPTGGPWVFNGASPNGSGIVVDGSAFSNPSAPEGVQAAFIQELGSISQSITGFIPGTNYTITFSAAVRQGNSQSWNVKIDNTVIGSYNPGSSATSYTDYTASFIATATTHKLSFVGTDLAGGDNTVFIDNVRISPIILSPPFVVTNTLPVTAVDVVGGQVTFTATFSSLVPITYQWQKISGGVTNNIAGSTSPTLTLANLQLSDAASYQLRATNVYGVAASAPGSLTVNNVPGAVNNVITEFAAQTGLGSVSTNFAPTWMVASGSLIVGQSPSSVGGGNFSLYGSGGVAVLANGSAGSFNYWPGMGSSTTEVVCGDVASGAGQSVTYTLTGWTNGFSLTNITVYGGWGDAGRDSQDYTVYYSTISSPSTFVQLGSVNFNPANPNGVQSATRVTLMPAAGFLATNVAAVKVDFTTPTPENDACGYSEIQVFGTRTGALPLADVPTCSPNSTVAAGIAVTFSDSATGTAPIQYQWQSDNGSGGANYTDIAGATSTNYVLNTANFGNFTVNFRIRITNPIGTSISPALQLIVTNANSTLSSASVGNLRCEHLLNPLGIDVRKPRLSWSMNSAGRGDRQTAYQILVASSPTILSQDTGDLWSSGVIVSDQSVLVNYGGQALTSGQACYWKVRIWDENGNYSAWSPTAIWSMGLLNSSDWIAQWIGMNENTNISPAPPSPMLRKMFTIDKPVARAMAYICGLGYYEMQLNGTKQGDHVLDPSWTHYDYHSFYTTFDVTTNLVQGQNVLGVQLANSFYNQWATDYWNTATAPWRAQPQMILQLVVQYTDGTSNMIISDPTWKASTGPLVLDTTRLGEVYDARLEQPGWATAGFNDSAWTNAIAREGIAGTLLAPDAEPVKVFQSVYPVRIIPVSGKSGVYTFDFGQNLAGWGQLTVSGSAGTSVSMVYGELTNGDNSVNQNNINGLVGPKQYFQTDTYILKGVGTETYAPRFTYHGFRYAQVTGLPSPPTTNTLVAQVVHTDLRTAGNFLCANQLLNQIETNTLWSYLNNFVGIPTDCPTREKQGWDGDAQLACEVGQTHFESAAAYTRWLKEFAPGQLASGDLSGVYPNADYGYAAGPAWEGAMLLIPWFVYQHSGDAGLLTNNYSAMKAYVNFETTQASGNIVSYGLGDWAPASTVTPTQVTDTGYYYETALILAQTAALMGNTADSVLYSNLAAQIKVSFNSNFYNPSTAQYSIGSETAQSCALYQGLTVSNQVSPAAQTLVTIVGQNNNTVNTGILGSKYLLRTLCDNGHSDVAMSLAQQTNYPSWGNWITQQGATTLYESWNGSSPGTSLDHIMFGDISAWFMEYLAGIRPGSPGYKSVLIKPEITGAIAWAQATHSSPYGAISNAWQISGQSITMNVVIPPNSTGVVYLPTLGTSPASLVIKEGGATIWTAGAPAGSDTGVTYDHFEGASPQTYSVWDVTSGNFQFTWTVLPSPPKGLSAQAGNGWVDLNWTPLSGAASYNVKRSSASGGPYTVISSPVFLSSFSDVTVSNGQNYYYVVSAVNAGGESANSAEVSAMPLGIANFSFETPQTSGYSYNPTGGSWTFSGASPNGSGILGNGSLFGNPNAPDGMQAAFVQEFGTISQALTGFTPGTVYTILYSAAQRSGNGESWNVLIDNQVIKTNAPGGTSYGSYAASFTATSTTHVLSFRGTDLATGDNTVFIDNVQISPSIQPLLSSVMLTNPANNTGFPSFSTIPLAATVVTNGNLINSVNFYANGTNFIGQATHAPYTVLWTNVGSGPYSLVASVNFNGGATANSAAVNITVTNLPPVLGGIVFAGTKQLAISGTGRPGQAYVLVSATNLVTPMVWTSVLTNLANGSGNIMFTNLPLDGASMFYRIVGN